MTETRFPLVLGVLLGYKILYDKMGIKQILEGLEKEIMYEGGKKYVRSDYGSSISDELAESQLEEATISIQAAEDDLKAGRYSRAVFKLTTMYRISHESLINNARCNPAFGA